MSKENHNFFESTLFRFCLHVLLVTIIFGGVQIHNCCKAKERQDLICTILTESVILPQTIDVNTLDALSVSFVNKNDSIKNEKLDSIHSIWKSYTQNPTNQYRDIIGVIETVEKLLHLEFMKIQEERTSVTLWIGIITVVFLIFSFYSMFKSDDLVKQSNDGLCEIKEIKKNIEEIEKECIREIKTRRDEFDNLKKDFEKEVANIKTENNKIKTELEQKFIDYIDKQIASNIENIKDFGCEVNFPDFKENTSLKKMSLRTVRSDYLTNKSNGKHPRKSAK